MTSERDQMPVLVRGAGDVGSAVAAALFHASYTVAMHDDPAPTTSRRGMAFTDAVFDGSATLEGLTARRVETGTELRRVLTERQALPVAVWAFADMLRAADWSAIIDARMRKREVPEPQRGLAPLTIGLGPNFVAGEAVDVAIETSWGERLGAVIEVGPTLALAGEPRALGGVGRSRFVYASAPGRFDTTARIGETVEANAVVAVVAGIPLRTPNAGIIRGLTHAGVEAAVRTKVLEVDPRGDPAAAFGMGERPRRIAIGVFTALRRVLSARRQIGVTVERTV